MKHLALIGLLALTGTAAWAVQPDEILPDAALEQRARNISQGLRCLVCRNESIDESNADLARDLRLLVRERLVAGDSDTAVVDYVVARFGEYVLLKPQTNGSNWLLWGAGPAMMVVGLGVGVVFLRRRQTAPDSVPALSADEQTRLRDILNE